MTTIASGHPSAQYKWEIHWKELVNVSLSFYELEHTLRQGILQELMIPEELLREQTLFDRWDFI